MNPLHEKKRQHPVYGEPPKIKRVRRAQTITEKEIEILRDKITVPPPINEIQCEVKDWVGAYAWPKPTCVIKATVTKMEKGTLEMKLDKEQPHEHYESCEPHTSDPRPFVEKLFGDVTKKAAAAPLDRICPWCGSFNLHFTSQGDGIICIRCNNFSTHEHSYANFLIYETGIFCPPHTYLLDESDKKKDPETPPPKSWRETQLEKLRKITNPLMELVGIARNRQGKNKL